MDTVFGFSRLLCLGCDTATSGLFNTKFITITSAPIIDGECAIALNQALHGDEKEKLLTLARS